jgi:hypothetical protein
MTGDPYGTPCRRAWEAPLERLYSLSSLFWFWFVEMNAVADHGVEGSQDRSRTGDDRDLFCFASGQ